MGFAVAIARHSVRVLVARWTGALLAVPARASACFRRCAFGVAREFWRVLNAGWTVGFATKMAVAVAVRVHTAQVVACCCIRVFTASWTIAKTAVVTLAPIPMHFTFARAE